MECPTAAGLRQWRGRYVTDVPADDALTMVVVPGPHAHARIARIDLDEARRLAGVVGAYALADLPELRGALSPPVVPAVPVKPYRQSALADGVVRFAGEPVVAVVAAYEARNVILSVLGPTAGAPQAKYGIVVDPDVNVRDIDQVLWALYTRVQPDLPRGSEDAGGVVPLPPSSRRTRPRRAARVTVA